MGALVPDDRGRGTRLVCSGNRAPQALALDLVNETARWAFVLALVLSLAGDVFLMLPDDERWFVPGVAFLLGHLAYIVGLFAAGWSAPSLAIGGVLAVVLGGSVGVRIVRAASAADAQMGIPVGIYIAARGEINAGGFAGLRVQLTTSPTIDRDLDQRSAYPGDHGNHDVEREARE